MHRRLLGLFLLLPISLFAQSAFDDCDNVFTKVQHIPALKVPTEQFNDTLAHVLKAGGFSLRDNDITLKFVVTVNGKIDEVTVDSGDVKNLNGLIKAIKSLASFWNPATQNGYEVCSYVRLKLVFDDRKIIAQVLP